MLGGRSSRQMKNKEQQRVVLEASLKYCAMGFSIIPVGAEKKPLLASWKPYQTTRATPEEITAWQKKWPDMNIACVTGEISNLAVVDIEKGGSTLGYPDTVVAQTGGGGWHLYFRYPKGRQLGNATRIRPLTDIRAEGGYVVLPPSDHPSGGIYGWLFEPGEREFAEFPMQMLETAINLPTTSTLAPGQKVPVGQRNDTATRFIGRVLHHLPAELWETVAWPAAKHLNQSQFATPLDESELLAAFASISNKELGRRPGGKTNEEKEAELKRRFTPFTLADLYKREFPPARWLVQNLIPLGGLTALTGAPASFKTFLTQALATSVMTGVPFLSHFPTTKGKVLIIDQENQLRLIKERFGHLHAEASDNIFFLSQEGIKIDAKEDIDRLQTVVQEINPVLVVMDSLVRFHRGEENSAKDMSLFFEAAQRLSSDGRAVVFLHHHRKQFGFGRQSSAQEIRGSSDIPAAVECHLSIDRKAKDTLTITQTKLRVQPELKRFKVALVTDEQGIVSFVYQGEDDSENEAMLKAQEAISAALAGATEPMPIKVLAKQTDLSEQITRKAVKELVDSGEVKETKGPHNRSLYALAPKNEAAESEDEKDVFEELNQE